MFNPYIHQSIGCCSLIPLVVFKVGLHYHYVETNHRDLPLLNKIYYLFHIHEIELEVHLIYRSHIYYEIQEELYHLYQDLDGSLSTFFQYMYISFYEGGS